MGIRAGSSVYEVIGGRVRGGVRVVGIYIGGFNVSVFGSDSGFLDC